jgi:hypothetical protein
MMGNLRTGKIWNSDWIVSKKYAVRRRYMGDPSMMINIVQLKNHSLNPIPYAVFLLYHFVDPNCRR